ncbi:MAG TPA: hypothetical protein VFG83_05090 [Kofleriaceae bacterium]|nr:hypothetical protein [Kofleriaceae bacterium]
MEQLAVEFAIRFGVFAAVFALGAWRHPRVSIRPKVAFPLVVLLFAALNAGLYWLAKSVLVLASVGLGWLIAPFVVNACLLWLTARILRPLKLGGIGGGLYLAALVTVAHLVLWVAFSIAF